jgi:O-antigen ligase
VRTSPNASAPRNGACSARGAVAGVAIGTWIDRRWPDGVSWTLMMLTLGLLVGCWNAWGWITMERRAIERERTGVVDDEHAGS